jgi:hypothetical protein
LKKEGLTVVVVAASFLRWRIQPLQERVHYGFEYAGVEDPNRLIKVVLSDEVILAHLNKFLLGVKKMPPILNEFSTANPLVAVSIVRLKNFYYPFIIVLS